MREEFFRAAHDIKGQAATFGYPLAAEVADSLCRLVEHAPDQQCVPPALIDQHVDGVRAIMRKDAVQPATRPRRRSRSACVRSWMNSSAREPSRRG